MTIKRLITALLGFLGARFIGAGLGLLTQLTLTHILAPEAVATVLLAMSAAAFLSLILNGGHTQLASTHLPKLMTLKNQRAIAAVHGTMLRDMVWVMLVVGFVVLLLFWLDVLQDNVMTALIVGLVCAPFSAVMRYNSIIANSLKWFPLSYIPDFIVRPGLFLIAILPVIWLASDQRMWWVLIAFVAMIWIVTIGQAVMMQGQALHLSHWAAARRPYIKAMRPKAWALFIVGLVTYASADIVMLLAGTVLPAADVAVVGIAVRLAALAGFVLQAAQLFVLPDYAKAVTTADEVATRAVLWRVNLTTLGVIVAALIGALVLGRFALSLFGPAYVSGAWLLVLLLIGQSIRSLAGLNQSLLSLHGYQLRTALSCVIAVVILVTTTILFTRNWGSIGVGYAVIVSEIAWLLGLAAQANRLCGRRADLLWLITHTMRKESGH
jgi:O-antigen/teichoic acid export membrane protein